MSLTLPMRQISHRGVFPCLKSPPQMMRTVANAKHVNLHTKMILTLLHREKSSSMTGWQYSRLGQDMTMLTLEEEA